MFFFRSRLYDLFREIEREFETLYADHVTCEFTHSSVSTDI